MQGAESVNGPLYVSLTVEGRANSPKTVSINHNFRKAHRNGLEPNSSVRTSHPAERLTTRPDRFTVGTRTIRRIHALRVRSPALLLWPRRDQVLKTNTPHARKPSIPKAKLSQEVFGKQSTSSAPNEAWQLKDRLVQYSSIVKGTRVLVN